LQIVVRVTWTPEDYLVAQKHSSMARPSSCPHCSVNGSLAALGYYERWLSGTHREDLRISVRRFRCLVLSFYPVLIGTELPVIIEEMEPLSLAPISRTDRCCC